MNNSRAVYLQVLNERISDLNKQISQVEAKIAQSKIVVSRYEKQAIALRKEIEKIEQEKKDYNVTNNYKYKNDLSIELLDKYYDSKEEKKQKIEEQIADLNNLKKELRTKGAKNRVDRKIARRREKLQKLQKRESMISGVQRTIIMSKRVMLNRKNRAFSKQEANVDFYDNKLNDTQAIRNSLDPNAKGLKGIKDTILDGVYGLKERHYMKKKAKHEEILKTMQEKKVGIKSANAMVMKKKAVDKLRSARDQYRQMKQQQENSKTNNEELIEMLEQNEPQNTNTNNNEFDDNRMMLPAVIR